MNVERAWLGRLPYLVALERQRARREEVLAGQAPEALWALEHDPVITTGRRAPDDLPSAEALAARGVALVQTERGGLATWHGPGQLVIYVIIDAAGRGIGVKGTVSALEQAVIRWLGARGVAATLREGFPGVWVPSPTSACGLDKICAIGLHFRRGVSMHGLALNLRPSLDGFGLFTPCGVRDGGVTSLLALTGDAPHPEEAANDVLVAVSNALRVEEGLTTAGTSNKQIRP